MNCLVPPLPGRAARDSAYRLFRPRQRTRFVGRLLTQPSPSATSHLVSTVLRTCFICRYRRVGGQRLRTAALTERRERFLDRGLAGDEVERRAGGLRDIEGGGQH